MKKTIQCPSLEESNQTITRASDVLCREESTWFAQCHLKNSEEDNHSLVVNPLGRTSSIRSGEQQALLTTWLIPSLQ